MVKLTKYETEQWKNLCEANQTTLNVLSRTDNTTICYTIKELPLIMTACLMGGVLLGWLIPLT